MTVKMTWITTLTTIAIVVMVLPMQQNFLNTQGMDVTLKFNYDSDVYA